LGNGLIAVVQEYLEQNSTEDDLELFFEVHGRQPPDLDSWPQNILADLERHRIPLSERFVIQEQAVELAVKYVTTRSPLAWG
jgi:hypothetical protein